MNRGKKKPILPDGFKEQYNLIPDTDKPAFVDECRKALDWSITTFYNRLSGRKTVLFLEVGPLEKMFKKYKVDLFTCKPIK